MATIAIIAFAIICIAWCQVKFNLFHLKPNGLRVLMYHRVVPGTNDFLTVSSETFERHLHYLLEDGYEFISLTELGQAVSRNVPLKGKKVLLTFDDGYQNNYEHVLPILKRYGLKAGVFLPVKYIGKTNEWDTGNDALMNWEELKKAQPYFEYGLHSFHHKNMAEFTPELVIDDLTMCETELLKSGLTYIPSLAYPYGKYPKNKATYRKFIAALAQKGIWVAFRIGNRINRFPIKDKFLLKRIDIRGTDSFEVFKTKVAKGYVSFF